MLNLNKLDLTGRNFGLLKVKRIYQIKGGNVWWTCECVCGSIVAVKANDLRVVNDCGCLGEYDEDVIVIKKSNIMFDDLGLDDSTDDTKTSSPVKPSTYTKTSSPVKPSTYTKTSSPVKPSTYTKTSLPVKQSRDTKTNNSTNVKSKKVKVEDVVGRKFGKLTVLEYAGVKYDCKVFRCRCDCGKEVIVKGTHLMNGKRTMCHANTCPLRNK